MIIYEKKILNFCFLKNLGPLGRLKNCNRQMDEAIKNQTENDFDLL
jgi:hypothetical protein